MPRGGSRAGAGRPTNLSFEQRVVVGQQVEQLVARASEQAAIKLLASHSKGQTVEWNNFLTQHIENIRADARGPVTPALARKRSEFLEQYFDDVQFARQTDYHISDDEDSPARIVIKHLSLPRGTVDRIIRAVARERKISVSSVKRCRKEYQAFLLTL